jgi:hypothetical protein
LPARGVAGSGRQQDPHRFDLAYQGVVDYQPQPVGVSISHLSATEPPLDQRRSANRTLHTYSLM